MSYISDIVKLVKGGKESFVKKMKLYFYIAIGIAIYVIVFGLLLLIIHGIIMFTKNVPVVHSCPYNYSSYGLNAETSFPIIGTVVDTVVGVIYSNKRDPETCQKTCEKKCSASDDPTTCMESCKYDCRYNGVKGGVLNGYRDNILNNLNFQIVRIIVVVFVISILGVTFLFGFTPMRASEFLKKLTIIGLFLFATDSRSYVLYDQFLEPLVLIGGKQLSGMINGILLASMDSPELIAYSNAHPNNEFIVLDASISIFFSQAIFDKMGSLTFTDMSFMFMAPIFYLIAVWITINYFFFAVIVVFYRVVIVVGLSLFPMFVLFTAMAVTSKSLDKTTKYFTNYIQEVLIKPTISIFFLTYVMSFFAMLILGLVLGVFSFQVCVKRVFDPPPGLDFVLPTFDYYEAVKPFATKDVAGTILGFNVDRLDLPETDPNSLKKRGNSDILFSMMILNFILLSVYAILFRKIFGFVIQTAEKLNAAFGGSGLGEGGGGFKDIMDKASAYGGKAADLASQGIQSIGSSVTSNSGDSSKQGIGKDVNDTNEPGKSKEGDTPGGNNPAKENFTKSMQDLRDKSISEGNTENIDEKTPEPQTESQNIPETSNNGTSQNPTDTPNDAPENTATEGKVGDKKDDNTESDIEGNKTESKSIRGTAGVVGEATQYSTENSYKGGAQTDSTISKPDENPTLESKNYGKGGAMELEKEIQREKDIIKKIITNKRTVETEEMEGELQTTEVTPTPPTDNTGVASKVQPNLQTPTSLPDTNKPNVEVEDVVVDENVDENIDTQEVEDVETNVVDENIDTKVDTQEVEDVVVDENVDENIDTKVDTQEVENVVVDENIDKKVDTQEVENVVVDENIDKKVTEKEVEDVKTNVVDENIDKKEVENVVIGEDKNINDIPSEQKIEKTEPISEKEIDIKGVLPEDIKDKITQETPIQKSSEDKIKDNVEEITPQSSTPKAYDPDIKNEEVKPILKPEISSENNFNLKDNTSNTPAKKDPEINLKTEDYKPENNEVNKNQINISENIVKDLSKDDSPSIIPEPKKITPVVENNIESKAVENTMQSPLGHTGNTTLGHKGDEALKHGGNNPVKNEIDTPFSLESENAKGEGKSSFEEKIATVEAIKKGVEKKSELMQKVQAAKQKKDFLDKNVKAVSNKEDIAKFRKKSTFLNNQNKDKK